jgi:hypothetical protein
VKLSHVTATATHAHDVNATSHKPSNVLFSTQLQDVPGKQLVVVGLEFKPKGKQASAPFQEL